MTKQGSSAVAGRRAQIYKRIAEVWDKVPEYFQATELYELAGLNPAPVARQMIAAVLKDSFKCQQIGLETGKRKWRKGVSLIHTIEGDSK